MKRLREYLAWEAQAREASSHYAYNSIADLVAREGVEFDTENIVDCEQAAFAFGYKGTPRQCFQNALTLVAMHSDRLVYVEGYALRAIPIHHAWAVEVNTLAVIDPTWSGSGVGLEYLGLPFRFEHADRITDERNRFGVLDDWQHDWPLLRHPLDHDLIDERVKETTT